MERLLLMGKRLPPLDPPALSADPDWKQCDPAFIRRALDRALQRPAGGWYAVDATGSLSDKPRLIQINGEELVAYRIDGASIVARHAGPHLGGPLSLGKISNGKLVCPWHGLRLPSPNHGHWQPLRTHEDGVLTWVRLGPEEQATPAPILPVKGYCDVDIAAGGATQARYVRVEDGELYPCPGGTPSEGADLDAVQALGVATAGGAGTSR